MKGRRRIKVEVRGLPETRHMLMLISERMKRVGDLATKMKFVCKDIKETDEIKIYSEEFLIPDDEDINIIETGEKIIVKVKRKEESLSLVDWYLGLASGRAGAVKERNDSSDDSIDVSIVDPPSDVSFDDPLSDLSIDDSSDE